MLSPDSTKVIYMPKKGKKKAKAKNQASVFGNTRGSY